MLPLRAAPSHPGGASDAALATLLDCAQPRSAKGNSPIFVDHGCAAVPAKIGTVPKTSSRRSPLAILVTSSILFIALAVMGLTYMLTGEEDGSQLISRGNLARDGVVETEPLLKRDCAAAAVPADSDAVRRGRLGQSAPPEAPQAAEAANSRAESPDGGPRRDPVAERLRKRKTIINSSTDVPSAVANKDTWIIEVADACTADQFDIEQTRLLRRWVAEGGVLWVNSDVLSLFGVRYTSIGVVLGTLECEPARGTHFAPENCKRVFLRDCERKAHTLEHRDVIPLLNEPSALGFAGCTLWSLVPYGKGWISDPKPVMLDCGDGAVFLDRFYQFCLREVPYERSQPLPLAQKPAPKGEAAVVAAKPGGESSGVTGKVEPPAEPLLSKGPLSGTWLASGGAKFRIDDDDDTATVELTTSGAFKSVTGKLTRKQPGDLFLEGRLEMFLADRPQRQTTSASATLVDERHLKFTCKDWPVLDKQGRLLKKPWTEVLTRE